MKYLQLIFFCLVAHATYSQNNSYKPKHEAILDAKYGEQLQGQCSREFPDGVDSFFTPTIAHTSHLYQRFKSVLKLGVVKNSKGLKKYGYQYIGVVIKDTPYLYVNAFMLDEMTLKSGWEKYPFMACDGGDKFWGVLFCLTNMKFSQLAINGGLYWNDRG